MRELAERIAAIREVMMEMQRREMDVRKQGYDRGKLLRTFDNIGEDTRVIREAERVMA